MAHKSMADMHISLSWVWIHCGRGFDVLDEIAPPLFDDEKHFIALLPHVTLMSEGRALGVRM